jgi:8-oxo-dGTP pyrophosphatase MutT (NUDIX family)
MNNISAGVFFYAKNTQRFLYLLRTDSKNPGNWGIPGGKIEDDANSYAGRACKDFIKRYNAKYIYKI